MNIIPIDTTNDINDITDIEKNIIKCQICIETPYNPATTNGIKCNYCNDGFVCNECNGDNRNITQCPLCRRYNWYGIPPPVGIKNKNMDTYINVCKKIGFCFQTLMYMVFINAIWFIVGYIFLSIDKNFKCRKDTCTSLVEDSSDIGFIYTWGFISFVILFIFYNIYDNNLRLLRSACSNCMRCIMCEDEDS